MVMRLIIQRGLFPSEAELRATLSNLIVCFDQVIAQPFPGTYSGRRLKASAAA
jgi:hypothetical protein